MVTENEFDWGEPILPAVTDPEWVAEVKADIGLVPDLMNRVSRSQWLRRACLKWPRYKVQEFPNHLADIGALVIAQANACRYCYGIARSEMRFLGYSEKMINGLERDMHLADLNEKERLFLRFCRNLARSNPRPTKSDCDQLIRLGYSQAAVAEMAFYIVNQCFINRVATFISSPPVYKLEKLSGSILGRILRPLIAKKLRDQAWSQIESLPDGTTSFSGVVNALSGLPAATVIHEGLTGAFSSNVLSAELKILMFAVVARMLECDFCKAETLQMARDLGFSQEEFDKALLTLTSPRLNTQENEILTWTRETVHYQTGAIQKRLQSMANAIDQEVLLESIGVASLANTTVRLAVLLN